MKIKLRTLYDKVIIDPDKDEKEMTSGLVMPRKVMDEVKFGTVLACGPGLKDQPAQVKVGDKVAYGQMIANEIEYDNRVVLMMRESDIFFIDERENG
jgi:chaperonin GroES